MEDIQQSYVFNMEYDPSSRTAKINNIENNKENVVRTLCCDICFFLCQSKEDLKKHVELHENTCKICNELFPSSDKLENHLVMYHGEPKYSCTLCGAITWNKIDIMHHFFTLHFDPFCNVCSSCKREFQTKYAINRHMYSKHCKLCVACTICRRTYNSISSLKSHTSRVHFRSGPVQSNSKHQICRKRIQPWDGMERHMLQHEHHKPYLYLNVCTTCGQTFPNKGSLRKHVPIHGESNPYICPVCLKAFDKRANQVQHILTHMDHVYKCHICGSTYSRRAALILHMRKHPGFKKLPVIPVIGIVGEFVRNYLKNTKKSSNFFIQSNVPV